MAPMFWNITRKDKRFVITVRPGSHSKHRSIPTAVFLRNTLQLVSTLREAKAAIYSGYVQVDGIVRKSLHHSIGLMDVVELENHSSIYRLVPKDGYLLRPITIDASEKTKKLCRVKTKTTISGGLTQIGFHDGRSLRTDTSVNIGDTCVLQIPEQKILDVLPLEIGSLVTITRGLNAGQMGTIKEIHDGTFILQKRLVVSLKGREINIPTDIVIVVGKGKPVIQIE